MPHYELLVEAEPAAAGRELPVSAVYQCTSQSSVGAAGVALIEGVSTCHDIWE